MIGCGGGGGGGSSTVTTGGTSTTGSSGGTTATTTGGAGGSTMVFNVQWPASTRDIPGYANCVIFTLQRSGGTPITQTINRTVKTAYLQKVTFTGLASGTYNVEGDAFLNFNGGGPIVATFSAQLQVQPNTEVDAPLSFASTIASVAIDGVPFFMQTGVTTQLSGHAVDNQGNILFLPPGSLVWSVTTGADLVDLTPAGFLSALAPGNVTVQLEDTNSGQKDSSDITITGQAITTTGTTATDTGGSTTTTGTTDATTTGTTDTGTTDTTGSTTTDTTTNGSTTGGTTTTGGSTGGTTDTGGSTGGTSTGTTGVTGGG